MAHSLGVRVFLYRRGSRGFVFSGINPHRDAAALTLVEMFEAPPPTRPLPELSGAPLP